MGLDFFLYEEEGVALSRKCGSTPWMYPAITPFCEFQNFAHLRVGDKFESRTIPQILADGKANNLATMLDEYYTVHSNPSSSPRVGCLCIDVVRVR